MNTTAKRYSATGHGRHFTGRVNRKINSRRRERWEYQPDELITPDGIDPRNILKGRNALRDLGYDDETIDRLLPLPSREGTVDPPTRKSPDFTCGTCHTVRDKFGRVTQSRVVVTAAPRGDLAPTPDANERVKAIAKARRYSS